MNIFFGGNNERHCPHRITRDTVDNKTVKMINGPIHPRGTCTISHDRSQPCHHLGNEAVCPDLINLDFCNDPWAKVFNRR